MKSSFHSLLILIGAALALVPFSSKAEGCELPVGVAFRNANPDVPSAVYGTLGKRIESMLGETGLVATRMEPPFVIYADIIDVSLGKLPGPPKQYTVNATLMLQLCDASSGTVIKSCTFDGVKGVGNSTRQAYASAFRPLSASNVKCKSFLAEASSSIEGYYNRQHPLIIRRAKTLASRNKFQEALFWLSTIPECCKGYEEAAGVATGIYQTFINTQGMLAYQSARTLWIASPDAAGAAKALPVLLTIPPGSEAWKDAESLANEIYATMKDDKNFETRTKYTDSVELEKLKTQAAREIGVAWGSGQQPSNTNILIK